MEFDIRIIPRVARSEAIRSLILLNSCIRSLSHYRKNADKDACFKREEVMEM
jgi:hypothetical protein